MDVSTVEHSDSDSGESWTLLENNPTYADDAPDIPENAAPCEREHGDFHSEKDEDTDGISIISDSEPESTPSDVKYVKIPTEETDPAEQQNTPLLSSPPPINSNNESVREDTAFLGDNVKYKTYVHRRNPKVGTILDIIMLGTFVITAGMALGHLWSCKNECTTQTSVNKILSNLYKLQEENAYLRNKLKEITDSTGYQLMQQRKSNNNKLTTKQYRCKKIFEEPVIKNNKVEMAVKCVNDNKPDVILHDPLEMPEHEKELLNDIDKMKNIYDQNKEWLDKEVKKQFEDLKKSQTYGGDKSETNRQLNSENRLGPIFVPSNTELPDVIQDTKTESVRVKSNKQNNLENQLGSTYFERPHNTNLDINKVDSKTESDSAIIAQRNLELKLEPNQHGNTFYQENVHSNPLELMSEKKISYADSLKIDQPFQRNQRSENNDKSRWTKVHSSKRKSKDDDILLNLNSLSEDDIKKDDRYTGPKTKHEKKKHDRQKSHKKQKRNKYEQWEMKGGYLRDFDEFSVTSSQDNNLINNPEKKFLNPDFENYVSKFIEVENNASNKDLSKITQKIDEKSNKIEKRSLKDERKKRKTKDSEWYEKRTALRAEARMKLEHELFGENTSNTAAWYFRRMQKREQCRAQKDNSTFKKFSKRKMNFKMKR